MSKLYNYYKKTTVTEKLFIFIALLFGVFLINVVPPMWGGDETSHTARVYQLTQAKILAPQNQDGSYGGPIPFELALLTRYVYQDLDDGRAVTTRDPAEVDSVQTYRHFQNMSLSGRQSPAQFTGAAAYSPIAYVGPILGMKAAELVTQKMGGLIYSARLAGLLLYIALVCVALRIGKNYAVRWLVFVIALLPMSLFEASVITADSEVIALSLIFFLALVRLLSEGWGKSEKVLWIAVAANAALIAIKPNYLILTPLLLLLPLRRRRPVNRTVMIAVAILVVGFLLTVIWAIATRDITSAGGMSNNQQFAGQILPAEQLKFILTHPFGFIMALLRTVITDQNQFMIVGMFGLLGFSYVATPLIAVCISLIALVLGAALDQKRVTGQFAQAIEGRTPIWFLVSGLLTVIGVFALFYITFTPLRYPLIMGVQGRYFLPALPFVGYGLIRLSGITISLTKVHPALLFSSLTVVPLLISYGYYYAILY